MAALRKASKDYRDMIYNAHSALRDYWTYDEIANMPLRNVIANIEYFTPKLREIMKRQQAEQLNAELSGKKNMKKPGSTGRG